MSSGTSSSSSIATFNGSAYELSVQRLLKYSFSSQSSPLLSDMLEEELRRWEVASTWFHQSRLPTLFGRSRLFSEITLLMRSLIVFRRSLLKLDILALSLNIDNSGNIQLGSRDDMLTVRKGI